MDEIISILEKCNYKGKYVNVLKKLNLWHLIDSTKHENLTDQEKVYLYLNPDTSIVCDLNKKKKFLGARKGYNNYCQDLKCQSCHLKKIAAASNGVLLKYGVDNVGKIQSAIDARERFWEDTHAVKAASEKRKNTNIERYGTENVFQCESVKESIKKKNLDNFGVENVSCLDSIKDKKKATTLNNFRVEYPMQSAEIRNKAKITNIEKYGVDSPMKNKLVAKKMIETKAKSGGFDVSNSSVEATMYFRKYIIEKKYSLSQVAFADRDNGLHEWGYYFDRWYFYDFVAFEEGHRGNPSKILEIVEYNGPFHYSEEDSKIRGQDKAAPWLTSTMTIAESVARDKRKENFARTLTENYKVIWSEKYHNKRK